MNQKIVTLSPDKRLVVEWGLNWSNLTIHQDGVLIGSVADQAALKAGRNFILPGGEKIMVLVSGYGLEIWHDGKELVSGTYSGSVDGFGSAFKMLISIGTLQLIIAAFYLFMMNKGGLITSVLVAMLGGMLIGLGLWARDSGSKTPFWIGIGLCVVNIILCIVSFTVGGLLISGILLYYLYRGTQSAPLQPTFKKELNENRPLDSDL